MKLLKQIQIFFVAAMLLMQTGITAGETVGRAKLPPLYKVSAEVTGQFDGNRIRNDMQNSGIIVSDHSGHSGMEWPKDNHTYSVYASGVWYAGKVDGDIRTAVGEYGPEMVAGPWGADPAAAIHKFYKVSKSDLADPLANDDFQNWPTDLGAPWVDEDGDGVYSPMPNGLDHPDFIGDQVVWYVANDGGPGSHDLFGTLPLGIEVQYTIFGFDRPDAFGDMMFVKALAINKGGNSIEEMYIGLWSDPDLGDAGDDFVGCDTTLSLGICYNDGIDTDFAGYSGGTPAVGYDFFQGPIVASVGDTALAYGRHIPGFKNLPMSSFSKYINPDPVYFDPNDAIEAYNYMMGLMADGSPFPDEVSGGTRFVHPGDPSKDTGPTDTEYVDKDTHASGDRRFLMNSGPFTMADGDSQEVVFGILHAAAGGPLKSFDYLKQLDALAQLAYDIQFALPESPPVPEVTVTTLPEEIVLVWGDEAESYKIEDVIDKSPVEVAWDTTFGTGYFSAAELADLDWSLVTDTSYTTEDSTVIYTAQFIVDIDITYGGENTWFKFEGYNVYQVETLSGTGGRKRIATYDLNNGIGEIFDNVFDAALGEIVKRRVHFGNDGGVKRFIKIDSDHLNNGIPLKTNREYYYAVTAYGYNPYGIPRTLESSLRVIAIRPQYTEGIVIDSLAVSGSITAASHTDGASDGSVAATVIDPTIITGDDYEISFGDSLADGTKVINWTVTSGGSIVSAGNTIQGGVDFVTGDDVGTGSNPIIDGLLFEVNGPPLEFKDFYVTQNADGPIDGYAGAAADYNGYPGMGRENIGNQQSNGSTWFITDANDSYKNYEDFYPHITRYAGGYGNPDGRIGYLIPDDFEFRFTEAGGKMYDIDGEVFIDVPLECWNIGDVTDPADDFQLLPVFYDLDWDGNGEWNLYQDDHAVSGGTNDPYMEGFYVVEHVDRAPGTDGYDAMIASLTADPAASGNYIWATGPGLPLAGANQVTRVVMLNMTFANWNGGSVDAADWPANVDAVIPETGTVFRIVTTKPNSTSDVFTLKTEALTPQTKTVDIADVKVWPNPYFGYNPEERNPVDQQMHFTHLPETGNYDIRIFDLAGNHVRTITGSDAGSQFAVWDLRNDFGIPVASGMYLAHVEFGGEEKVLKLAVVQPEQRIDRY